MYSLLRESINCNWIDRERCARKLPPSKVSNHQQRRQLAAERALESSQELQISTVGAMYSQEGRLLLLLLLLPLRLDGISSRASGSRSRQLATGWSLVR